MKKKILTIVAAFSLASFAAWAVDIIGANPITATQIADNAITASKISDDAITQDSISDNSILAAKVQSIDSAADEECLTSEGTGFEWQTCGGGGGVVTELIYNFTASELRKAFTTPIELLPAPGADKAYIPLGPVVFSFDANTYPYTYFTTDLITYNDVGASVGLTTDNETVYQDAYIIAFSGFTVECQSGETITGSVSGATATVVASDIQTTGYLIIRNIVGGPFSDSAVDSITGGTSGCTGTVDVYTDESNASATVYSNDNGGNLLVVSTSGTFTNGAIIGGDTSGAITQVVGFDTDVPLNTPGAGAIHYGVTASNTFVDGSIDHPTQGGNTDKIVLLPASQQVALRAYSYFNNQPVTFSTTADWTDGSDNDSNGDGTATLYLYYKTIDL